MNIIIEDTRNQIGKHKNINSQLTALGWTVEREALGVGDYALVLDRSIVIDTKKDMQEVYGNLIQDHKRFREECERAKKRGIKLIILVEQDGISDLSEVQKWVNPRIAKYYKIKAMQARGKGISQKLPKRPPVASHELQKKMQTMSERYGVSWEFCGKADTGQRILELLGV